MKKFQFWIAFSGLIAYGRKSFLVALKQETFYYLSKSHFNFRTNHYMAKLQRGVTGSNFDHIGMVVRDRNDGEIMVFDVRNL